MFLLAHLSDPHLAPLPQPRWSELAGKRATGYLNWRRKRARVHRSEVLARVVADLEGQSPDHIAVTGDLVNIALTEEFAPARAFLARLGAPSEVTVVPGTYDDAVAASAALAGEHDLVISDTSWPGYEDPPRRVIEGYATIFAELDDQLWVPISTHLMLWHNPWIEDDVIRTILVRLSDRRLLDATEAEVRRILAGRLGVPADDREAVPIFSPLAMLRRIPVDEQNAVNFPGSLKRSAV